MDGGVLPPCHDLQGPWLQRLHEYYVVQEEAWHIVFSISVAGYLQVNASDCRVDVDVEALESQPESRSKVPDPSEAI